MIPANEGAKTRAIRTVIPKAEQSRRTRDLILDTASRCLSEHGYAQTTMLLIAKEAGLSRGPLHYHFSDKNELMAAVAERLPIRATDFARQRLAGHTTPEARLAAILEIGVREHLGIHHFVAMELLLAARNDPSLAAAIAPHMQSSEQIIDEWWTDYLAALHWPKEKLLAFRHLTVAALRGLALDRTMHADAEVHARALEMFEEVFMTFARSKGGFEA